jgi:hypothetical protein
MDVKGIDLISQTQEDCWLRQGGEAELCAQMPSVKQLLASMRCESAFSRFVPSTKHHPMDISRLEYSHVALCYAQETDSCPFSVNANMLSADSESLSSVELLSLRDCSPPAPQSNYMRILVDNKSIKQPEISLNSKACARKRRCPAESQAFRTVSVFDLHNNIFMFQIHRE